MKGLYFAAGIVIGAAAGIFGSKKYFEAKYESIFEEELQSIKESRIGLGHIQEKDSIEDAEFIKEVELELSNPDSELHSSLDIMTDTDEAVKQSEEVKKEIEDLISDRVSRENIISTEDLKKAMDNEEPFEISEEEYAETEPGFDKITLHYFTDDDVLVNAETNEQEIGRTIGDEGINKIRMTDESSTYFRDYLYGCDYEVIKIIGSFYTE